MAVDCEAMNDFYNIMAFAIIALPLITSLGFMVVPNLASRTCWLISSIVSLVTFGISVLLFVRNLVLFHKLTGGVRAPTPSLAVKPPLDVVFYAVVERFVFHIGWCHILIFFLSYL